MFLIFQLGKLRHGELSGEGALDRALPQQVFASLHLSRGGGGGRELRYEVLSGLVPRHNCCLQTSGERGGDCSERESLEAWPRLQGGHHV